MVMNMGTVNVRCHDEGMLSFDPVHRQLIADFVCFLRCNLAGFEGLTDLISDHIMGLMTSGDVLVLAFGEEEFLIAGSRIIAIGADIFSVIDFLFVLGLIGAVRKTLSHRFSFVDMQCNQSCCSHRFTSVL